LTATAYGDFDSDPIVAEGYDLFPANARRPDIGFYVGLAASAGGPSLELGCGAGRILLQAARQGAQITGLDVSRNLIERCRRKMQLCDPETASRVRLIQGDMTDFSVGGLFDLVMIPFRSLQYLVTVREQLRCLECVNRHLSGEGLLVFDVLSPNLTAAAAITDYELQDGPPVTLPDGAVWQRTIRIMERRRVEQQNRIQIAYYRSAGGETQRGAHVFSLRFFYRYEMEHLLARAGFEICEVFGGFDRSPLTDSSDDMIFLCRKRPE
jgi:SAM-dependent methyltransferase